MELKKLKLLMLGIFIGLSGAACAPAEEFTQPTSIHFDPRFSEAQLDVLKSSLNRLASLKNDAVSSPELESIFEVEKINSESLSQWLNDRVSFVLSPSASTRFYQSSQVACTEDFCPMTYKPDDLEPFATARAGLVLMSNVGAEIWGQCDLKGSDCHFDFPGWGVIPIYSPRIGLIQVGAGLYEFLAGSVQAVTEWSALATFFHEGRHSDGNTESPVDFRSYLSTTDDSHPRRGSLAFAHVLCPPGHPYQGQYACDLSQNGPYTVGAAIIDFGLASESLPIGVRSQLEGQAMGYRQRVLQGSAWWDPSPQTKRTQRRK